MANLLLNVKDIKWSYCAEDVAAAGHLWQTVQGSRPAIHSSLFLAVCSVNADPKVSIKGAVGRVATATPMQVLASPVTFRSGPCCG